VNAAQFNGLNLVKGTDDVNILSSLDRAADGTVSSSNITVNRQDMTTGAGSVGTVVLTGATVADFGTITDAAGAGVSTLAAATGSTAQLTFGGTIAAGNVFQVQIAGQTVSFTAGASDTNDTVRDAIRGQINALGIAGVSADAPSAGLLSISNTNAFSGINISVTQPASGGTLGITQLNGQTVTATSGQIAQRAESLDFSTSAAVTEGDSYSLTVGTRAEGRYRRESARRHNDQRVADELRPVAPQRRLHDRWRSVLAEHYT
jgi:flagellin